MKIATLCRRIRDNDASMTEIKLEDCNSRKIEKVLQALRESSCSNLRVEELIVRHCELTVDSFAALLLPLCKRPQQSGLISPPANDDTNCMECCFERILGFKHDPKASPLMSLRLCLHEVGHNIPAEDIIVRLCRGIAADKPPGLADLQWLKLCVGGLSERSMAAIQRLLRKPHTGPDKLDLSDGEWIHDGVVEKICHSLTCNATSSKLLVLNLNGNKVGNAGAQHLANMLTRNTILKELHLRSNEIGDQGAVDLAHVLECHNHTLTWLDLEKNQLGDAGVIAMARAVLVNSRLEFLSLKRNVPVTHVGEQFLFESVAEMPGLTTLTFGPIRKVANLKILATAMEKNNIIFFFSYGFWEDSFLVPEELAEFAPHERPSLASISELRLQMSREYDTIEIPDIKIEHMAKYISYIFFMAQMNMRLRRLLDLPEEYFPKGLWAYILVKPFNMMAPSPADSIFCLLRERPGFFCA
jgi:hypothetical protein